MTPSALPPAPRQLVHERGVPAFGMYQGVVETLSWSALKAPPLKRLTRKLHHKRWQYAALAHEAFFVATAIVDLGWTSTAFAYLFDREQGRVVASFSANGLPGVSTHVEDRPFGDATFRFGRERLAFRRAAERLELTINCRELKLVAHIELSSTPPVMAAIAPANWLAHSTHKSGGLAVTGFAEAAGRRYSLDDAVASLDASNGLLARDTRWRWASAHNRELGFNLQAGYMGNAENAIWLNGRVFRVGEARFDYDAADLLAPWRIASCDGVVELVFQPEGARREDRDLVIAASRYVQPIGTFSGRLTDPASGAVHTIDRLTGVTEDHHSRW
ncbi:DUF2804 domain-containing protein [Crenobacter sp. SG2305]|uniref:DUF2804 domain-containing protein n=1 Tax=Crenobacter oryzisoli TaxID=3056844 RepID=UPI0025AAE624|nr:DUF2804 domain-containing protein [Crenobacter sp. SG2305]MDN0083843.1 DUF2804 domain-containing protein [Crenobacter sp. SG2305]